MECLIPNASHRPMETSYRLEGDGKSAFTGDRRHTGQCSLSKHRFTCKRFIHDLRFSHWPPLFISNSFLTKIFNTFNYLLLKK